VPKGTPNLASGEKDNGPLAPEQSKHLLRTKLFVPAVRPNQITRARLSSLMDGGVDQALILVSAPAGYGKTTLVSNWLKEKNIPSAWLSLDDGDNDPVRFLQYLMIALESIVSGIEDNLSGMLQRIQPAEYENVINLLLNELASASAPFLLVLDDLHVLHSEGVLKMLLYLIEHKPPQMHLVILTRTDPPLPLARLRVRGQLLDIRADQLRFTEPEIAAFLNETMGLGLSVGDLSALEKRTEGWIASLQLAALSIQGSHDAHSFVSAFTGSHHYVMDYLVEEVLKVQPKNVGDFLLQTSILGRLSGPLCEAVVEPDLHDPINGQAMLESLEGMNLFTIPLDDDRQWYRYHHLFEDVLRKRLEHQSADLLPELHRRASAWYENNGFLSESIQQAIAADDQDRAAKLIEDNGCMLLISGEVATLLNWTRAIDFQAENRPWLAIQKAWALAITGDLAQIEPTLQGTEKLLAPLEPTVEVRTLQGTIAAARAHCANSQGDTQTAAKFARQALDLLPDCSSISQSIRSVTTSILGDASWINGDLEEARRAYTDAIRIGREAGNHNMVIIAESSLGDIFIEQGHLHKAADTYNHALQMAVRPDGQRSPLAGNLYLGLGRLAYERNELVEAGQYINQCIDLCRQWGDKDIQAIACAMLGRLEQALGRSKEAGEAIREAERLASEHRLSPGRYLQLLSELMRFWLVQGDPDKPLQRIEKWSLSETGEIPYKQELKYTLLLRTLLAKQDLQTALSLSERLENQAESTGRLGAVIETLVLQALTYQGMKDTDHALMALGKALSLAQPERYVRIFLDEGEAMTRLLCQAESRQVGSGYAAVLLTGIDKSSGMTHPSMQLLIDPLTSRELEVLNLIKAGSSNQDIARQLVISITTVKRHISNLYAKLGVESRTQAVAIARELNLFE
jgi:LuxR family transcriptional regulator, maltose regulon positive regulatory protein